MPVAIIRNFRQFFFQENGFQLLENWPPQSPDLNIIENLWNYMKLKIREKHPTTVKELSVKFLKLLKTFEVFEKWLSNQILNLLIFVSFLSVFVN